MRESSNKVLDRVRQSLGRTKPLEIVPIPPAIDESIVRLAHRGANLVELFARRAEQNKMRVMLAGPDEMLAKLIEFLKAQNCRRIMLPVSDFLCKLRIADELKASGFDVRVWTEMTLDEAYDFDCGITDVYTAVAETGSLVIRAAVEHGRAISLVPPIHVAILEPKNLLPDLMDLFNKLSREGTGSSTIIITGPSKTADIEMNLVVGVHGPGLVQLFLLQ
jgi:L-lactate dehydrogenase complex protein LldG